MFLNLFHLNDHYHQNIPLYQKLYTFLINHSILNFLYILLIQFPYKIYHLITFQKNIYCILFERFMAWSKPKFHHLGWLEWYGYDCVQVLARYESSAPMCSVVSAYSHSVCVHNLRSVPLVESLVCVRGLRCW